MCRVLTRRQKVFLILLLALLVRLWGINAPYLDVHWIKQLQVAAIAKNFYLHGYHLLSPEVDWTADQPNYLDPEFPLVAFLAALLYPVFGVHEWIGRLVAMGFGLGMLLVAYHLLRLHLGDRAALYGLLFLTFTPSSWYYSRAFMSEPAMLFFSVLAVYCFSRWIGLRSPGQELGPDTPGGSPWFFLGALGAAALAFMVKPPAVLILLPLAYLAYARWGWGLLGRLAPWAFVILSLTPAALYYHHMAEIGRQYLTVGAGFEGGMWATRTSLLNPGAWSLIMMRLLRDHLTAIGVALLPLGLFLRPASRRSSCLFPVWLAAVAIYFLVVWGGNLRQTYYQLPLLLPAAGLLGLAWDRLLGSGVLNRAGNAALLVVFLVLCAWGVQPFFEQYTPVLTAAEELKRLDPSPAPVIVFPPGYNCLYYFDRPGWVGREGMNRAPDEVPPEDVPGPLYLTSRISRGARWAVYFSDPRAGGQRPDLQNLLKTTYLCAMAGPGFEIFDLSKPATRPPLEYGHHTEDATTL
ncbi:MAG: phospholipid carrier-dependent glycosyltransferase [candidate division WS1 bacterium]|nr:phospholipid carrier-dependent glycosyltransferase [candidate division WS1 bacterium]